MVDSVGVVWSVKMGNLRGLAEKVAHRRYQRALAVAIDLAPQVTEWLQNNAQWEDVTGHARASLECVVIEGTSSFAMKIKGGGAEAPYVVFLEFDNAGKFAIIGPALEYWGPIFAEAFRGFV
jgi:hypothetical protein